MFKSVQLDGEAAPQALVVGIFEGEQLEARTAKLDRDGALSAACRRAECTGETGRIVEAFPRDGQPAPRVLIVGLGKKDKFHADALRLASAAVGRRLAQTKDTAVRVDLSAALDAVEFDQRQAGRCFAESLGLLAWNYETFKKNNKDSAAKRVDLALASTSKRFMAGMQRGLDIADSTNFTRTLSQTPPNVATPDWMAAQAQKLADETGMTCTVFRGKQLEKERFVGLLNVGKASQNKPCMIRLEYTPKQAAKGRAGGKAVLIGKTMTYDSGGLSLKINNGMLGMKRDKDGGCAVLGAMRAIATHIRPERPVVALLASAENAISDEAYRPDDVITYRNGVSVEVTNTDAEGRLVLADALAYACEVEKPAFIVDVATLTGGIVIALGGTYAGYFCNDDDLRARLEKASAASGERIWLMPMHDEYREMMKSEIGDILNSNPNRKAHPIQGAAFLSHFVTDGIPWAHIDIAGVHVVDSDSGPFVKGPTGWGTRLLAELLSQ
jgi:leucyl aminopeptidase